MVVIAIDNRPAMGYGAVDGYDGGEIAGQQQQQPEKGAQRCVRHTLRELRKSMVGNSAQATFPQHTKPVAPEPDVPHNRYGS